MSKDTTTEDLSGTVAIVTGGSRGLGRAGVLALANAGASVVVMARRVESLAEIQAETNGAVTAVGGDVTNAADLESIVNKTLEDFGHIDVVINNAGGPGNATPGTNLNRSVPIVDVEIADFERSLALNTLAPFMLAKLTVPHMLEQGWGRLIYVSTSLGTMLRPGQTAYGPSKAASEAVAAIVAQELDGTGVTSNVVCPGGPASTGMASAEMRDSGKLIDPMVMGPPIVWLSSRASDNINGMRFIANAWDATLPAKEAAAGSGGAAAWAAGISDRDWSFSPPAFFKRPIS